MFLRKYPLCEKEPGAGGAGGSDDKAAKQIAELAAEVERLKTHNSTLLDEKKKVTNKLKEFDGLDVENIKKMMKTLDNSEEARLLAEGKVDEVVTKRIEKIQSNLESKIEDLSNKLAEKDKTFNTLSQKYNTERIQSAVRKSAEQLDVLPTAIEDVVLRSQSVFSIGEDGKIEARDADGNLRKSGSKVLTPELFVKDLEKSAPHFWKPSQGAGATGGSGKEMKNNPFSKDHWNLTQQAQVRKENPELAGELETEANKAT